MTPLLVLRPEPGATKTAAKARERGLDVQVHPLFEVRPINWDVDAAIPYDAVFITSANALKFKVDALNKLHSLPVLCVGEETAKAARHVGFTDITAGSSDARSLAGLAASLGYRHVLWLRGRPSGALNHPDLIFDVKDVYETPELVWTDQDRALLSRPLIALLHSPRAAQRFAQLVPDKAPITIVAISEKAAFAAGEGWADVHWAEMPSDEAMLDIAAPLCRAG